MVEETPQPHQINIKDNTTIAKIAQYKKCTTTTSKNKNNINKNPKTIHSKRAGEYDCVLLFVLGSEL